MLDLFNRLKIKELEKRIDGLQNLSIACLWVCFNLSDRARMSIRCHTCDAEIKTNKDGSLPSVDIDNKGFLCLKCAMKKNNE